MKYIITFLSTTLFLSLMLHVANYENMHYMRENDKLSDKIIERMSGELLDFELQTVD